MFIGCFEETESNKEKTFAKTMILNNFIPKFNHKIPLLSFKSKSKIKVMRNQHKIAMLVFININR